MDPLTLIIILVIMLVFFGGPRVYPARSDLAYTIVMILVVVILLRMMHII